MNLELDTEFLQMSLERGNVLGSIIPHLDQMKIWNLARDRFDDIELEGQGVFPTSRKVVLVETQTCLVEQGLDSATQFSGTPG
jgi:acetoacetate decarboxylase